MPPRLKRAAGSGGRWKFGAALLLAVSSGACAGAYPEVVVVNRIDEHVLVRNLSFNGCKWETVLAYGESTSVASCLPGEDRVHFQKFDPLAYAEGGARDPNGGSSTPLWFNYQSVSLRRISYGEFHRFELIAQDLEQDFSVPGPYGH